MGRSIRIITLLFIGIFLFWAEISSQDDSYLQVVGTVEYQFNPLSGAVIKLYEKSSPIETVTTGADGTFRFKLKMNSQYKVEISKGGLITKSIEFDTEIPADAYGKWTTEFAMTLFKPCEGVDLSPLNNPVDRVKYSSNKREFVSDRDYVESMRTKIQRVMMNIENCQINKFNDLVDEGNKEAKAKNYEEARKKYEEALEIYPDDKTVVNKLEDLDEKMKKDKNIDELYQNTIREGDALYAQKNYEGARQKYAGALRLKPGESYPRQKMQEIETMLAQQQQAQQDKAQEDAKYNSLIAQANAAYAASNYRTAKQLYEQASLLKPAETFPRQRVEQIKPLLQQQETDKQKKEEATREYNLAVSQADRLLQAKNYEEAKKQYLAALAVKPDQSYPRQKIEEIDKAVENAKQAQMAAQKAEIKRKIDQYLNEADNYFAAKDYLNARASYQKVLDLDPNDQYANQRLKRSESLMAQAEQDNLRKKEADYNEAISQGDNYLASDQYDLAIAQYNKALTIKPGDANAAAKIRQAESLKADYNRKALAQKELDKKYQDLINSGNSLLQQKNYETARQKFMEASNLKPGESLPQTKINEINQILAEQQKMMKQKEIDDKYNNFIQQADNYFNTKNYEQAKINYTNALSVKPAEAYPKSRLSQINNILAEQQQKLLAEKQKQEELDKKYFDHIRVADNYFRTKNYEQAKIEYNNALSLKPGETYPANQLTQIESLLAQKLKREEETKAREDQYNQYVASADNYFNSQQYKMAKDNYEKALQIKPEASHPKVQLERTNELLRKQEVENQKKLAVETKYNGLISQADASFNANDYDKAKSQYEQALKIKPDEEYPKERIRKILDIQRVLAANQQATNQTNNTVKPQGKAPAFVDMKVMKDSEKEKYLKSLLNKYPEGVTLEVYKEGNRTTNRYVVIRNNEVNEFREDHFSWGGHDYFINGKPITSQYFNSQVKAREGEKFQKFNM